MHFSDWPEVDAGWLEKEEAPNWSGARHIRSLMQAEIETLRREKIIGSSLEADVNISASSNILVGFPELDFSELAIVADVKWEHDKSLPNMGVQKILVTKTTNHKCGRCWRHLPEVADDGALCGRCEDVVNA